MDVDFEKIFNDGNGKKQSYPQPIVPQEEKPAENVVKIPTSKKILVHLSFISILIALGVLGMILLFSSFSAMFRNETFGIISFFATLVIGSVLLFAINNSYKKWRDKYDPDNILFRKW